MATRMGLDQPLCKIAFLKDLLALATIGAESERAEGFTSVWTKAWRGIEMILWDIEEEIQAEMEREAEAA